MKPYLINHLYNFLSLSWSLVSSLCSYTPFFFCIVKFSVLFLCIVDVHICKYVCDCFWILYRVSVMTIYSSCYCTLLQCYHKYIIYHEFLNIRTNRSFNQWRLDSRGGNCPHPYPLANPPLLALWLLFHQAWSLWALEGRKSWHLYLLGVSRRPWIDVLSENCDKPETYGNLS